MAFYIKNRNRERLNSGSFSMDAGGGRERMGSFAIDGGRERLNSTSSLFEGLRGRFDSTASINSFGQPPNAPSDGIPQHGGVRAEVSYHQPSAAGSATSKRHHTSPFSEYFIDHPQYADGDLHCDLDGKSIFLDTRIYYV